MPCRDYRDTSVFQWVGASCGEGGGGVWWQSPIWIAIGVIALVLLIMLIVMATRGGGTTVIKE